MAAPAPTTVARTRTGTVHVHGAEVSTDQTQLWDYAETIALLIAIVAFAAAVWIASAPRPDADIPQPAVIAPATGTFIRVEGDTRDVVQPDPYADGLAASTEVAIVRPDATLPDPLGTGAAPDPAVPPA